MKIISIWSLTRFADTINDLRYYYRREQSVKQKMKELRANSPDVKRYCAYQQRSYYYEDRVRNCEKGIKYNLTHIDELDHDEKEVINSLLEESNK